MSIHAVTLPDRLHWSHGETSERWDAPHSICLRRRVERNSLRRRFSIQRGNLLHSNY